MDTQLTKDAKKSLALLYSKYKKRQKKEPRNSASLFQEPYQIEVYRAVKPHIPELKQKGLVTAKIRQVQLTPEGIAYMENKREKTVISIVKAVKNFFSEIVSLFLKFIA